MVSLGECEWSGRAKQKKKEETRLLGASGSLHDATLSAHSVHKMVQLSTSHFLDIARRIWQLRPVGRLALLDAVAEFGGCNVSCVSLCCNFGWNSVGVISLSEEAP